MIIRKTVKLVRKFHYAEKKKSGYYATYSRIVYWFLFIPVYTRYRMLSNNL